MNLMEYFNYTFVRLIIIIIALLLAYFFVTKFISSKIFEPLCLVNSNSCAQLTIYKYKNSFVGIVIKNGIYIWFDGKQLYVYGQAPGECTDQSDYEPVDVFQITGSNKNTTYTRGNYQCITKINNIINYYIAILKVSPKNIYLKIKKQTGNYNIFDIFESLIEQGIVSVDNIQ